MSKKLSELIAATTLAIDDIMHLRTSGGIDKKMTGQNVLLNILGSGFINALLTEYLTTTVPKVLADSIIEINGGLYTNPLDIVIGGATANDNWYDIEVIPAGTTFTSNFIARNTGVWSDTKRGVYNGNDRIIGCVYRDSNGDFISKNIFYVINRTIKIKIEVGDWDMDADTTKTVAHGLSDITKIRMIQVIIRRDDLTWVIPLNTWDGTIDLGEITGGIESIQSVNITLIRITGGRFDNVNYDSIPFNRGWSIIQYEI